MMLIPRIGALVLGLALLGWPPAPVLAGPNEIPSCYAAFPTGIRVPVPARELFVFIDQTTPMDDVMTSSVQNVIGRLVTPGTAFTVATFSEAAPGRFPVIVKSGQVEGAVPKAVRNDVSVPLLKKLENCLGQQAAYGQKLAQDSFAGAVAKASGNYGHSDIMSSLRKLSVPVANSPARERIVILLSDMIEHSETSFYAKKSLRIVVADAEMAKVRSRGMIGNFGKARVFVVGGGTLPGNGYRPPATLVALEKFWHQWFVASNATVAEFGTPYLLQPVE